MDQQFQQNIEDQKQRLIQQFKELEELKDELEPEELEEMKIDTLKQLEEFENGLKAMNQNNLSLTDEINKAKQQLQNSIKGSVNKESIKQTMVQNESINIREKIKIVERDFNLNKISEQEMITQKLGYLNNLSDDLEQILTPEEKEFQDVHTGKKSFQNHKDQDEQGKTLLSDATQQIKKI